MKINIEDKLSKFAEHWSPRIIAELNGQHVKVAKLQGEFVWHRHEDADEMFFVIDGRLTMETRDATETLGPGEICVIPRGVEHRPSAQSECAVMLIEPAGTLNTGDAEDPRAIPDPEWI